MDIEATIRATAQTAPYILIVGKPGPGGAQYFIVFEKKIIFEEKNLLDSIILLFSVYYNFNISYVKLLLPILFFFQCYVFKIDKIPTLPTSLSNFIRATANIV